MSPVENVLNKMYADYIRGDLEQMLAVCEFPFVIFKDDGTEVLDTPDDYTQIYTDSKKVAAEKKLVRISSQVVSETAYGENLLLARTRTIVELANGNRLDPYLRAIVLRKRDGQWKIAALSNPVTRRLEEIDSLSDDSGGSVRDNHGSDRIDELVATLQASFAEKDEDVFLTQTDYPYVSIADEETRAYRDRDALRKSLSIVRGLLNSEALARNTIRIVSVMPYGASQAVVRVENTLQSESGVESDPYFEAYFLRQREGRWVMGGVLNSFHGRFARLGADN